MKTISIKHSRPYRQSLVPLLACLMCHTIASCNAAVVVPADTALVVDTPQSLYPDTTYGSVSQLTYQVDYFDTLTDGRLSSYENLYSNVPGIFLFRGGAFRDMPQYGKVSGRPDSVAVDWSFTTDYDGRTTDYGIWGGGTGWSGQPLYVHWPDSLVERFRFESPALTKHFCNEEIIVGSLAARLYFINFFTGDSSRRSIYLSNTIKGTPSIDPTLNGNIYIGQGIPCTRPFGALTVNMFKHKITHLFPQDKSAWRAWGAYDSSPIRIGQFLFRPGENGTIYKMLVCGDSLMLHSSLKFKKKGAQKAAGMESSISYYRNYGYVSDNHGYIVCFNLDNMQPVWCYDNHDDSDASPVLALEKGHPYLYSACEVDKQGSKGYCYFVKLDALTGELVWEQKISAVRSNHEGKKFDGGMFCTPLLGKGNCEGLIFANVVTNAKPGIKGDFVALRRDDGSVAYRTTLKQYAWSSPVALMNENNEMFVFTADTKGYVYLIDAISGKILFTKRIGANFESSPMVIDNHIVLGTRGRVIFKMSVL